MSAPIQTCTIVMEPIRDVQTGLVTMSVSVWLVMYQLDRMNHVKASLTDIMVIYSLHAQCLVEEIDLSVLFMILYSIHT